MNVLVLDLEAVFDDTVGDRKEYYEEDGSIRKFPPPACWRLVTFGYMLLDITSRGNINVLEFDAVTSEDERVCLRKFHELISKTQFRLRS